MENKIRIITRNADSIKEAVKFKNLFCPPEDSLKDLEKNGNIVILGNFDGVHKGHSEIFANASNKARQKGYNTIVYTFREYPQKLSSRITTPSEKIELIDRQGIDYIYIDEFEKIKDYTPEKFVDEILVNKLNTKEIYCGFNYTFGKNKSGNIKILDSIIREKYEGKITLNIQPPIVDSEGCVISSTRIRSYIEKADFGKIYELSGHNYIIMGEVVHGKKLGRTLGFPTANLKFENKKYPDFGVYGVYVIIEGEREIHHGVMNIGKNPTIENNGLSVETHILDFNRDIYGKVIMIEILEKISNEIKLNSIEELIKKIDQDARIWKERIEEKYYDTSKNR